MWEKKWDGHRVQGRSRAPPRLMATAYSLAKSDGKASLRCRTCLTQLLYGGEKHGEGRIQLHRAHRRPHTAHQGRRNSAAGDLAVLQMCARIRTRAARAKKRYTAEPCGSMHGSVAVLWLYLVQIRTTTVRETARLALVSFRTTVSFRRCARFSDLFFIFSSFFVIL